MITVSLKDTAIFLKFINGKKVVVCISCSQEHVLNCLVGETMEFGDERNPQQVYQAEIQEFHGFIESSTNRQLAVVTLQKTKI